MHYTLELDLRTLTTGRRVLGAQGAAQCRERSDGLYSTITYLLSKMVEELLVILFVSLTVSLCIFYAVDFHGQWILFWLVYLVTISIGMGERSQKLHKWQKVDGIMAFGTPPRPPPPPRSGL